MSLRTLARRVVGRVDPRFAEEVHEDGHRVVFDRLSRLGYLDGFAGKRILEIGPKHGLDSLLLAGLDPAELVLVDLPEKTPLVREWLPQVQFIADTHYVEGNLLYLSPSELADLGTFDLVWCLGVLYHNAEQLRLIRRLRTLCTGLVVIETEIDPSSENLVRLHWPEPWGNVQTMTHIPSRRAVASWMEMAGLSDVEDQPILSNLTSRRRAVLTGRASGQPYRSYAQTGLNPDYTVGEAS
jgi:SAM-dependent methyltransferase